MENSKNTTTATLAYLLMGFGWLLGGIGYIAALILSHVEHSSYEGRDQLLADHFRYLKRTGWYGLLWSAISLVLAFFLVGYVTMLITTIWVIYRSIKGYTRLQRGEFMYPQENQSPLD